MLFGKRFCCTTHVDTIFIQCCQLLNVEITFLGVNNVMIITIVIVLVCLV